MKKRGQVAAFAIVGLIVLVFSILIISIVSQKKTNDNVSETLELFPPEKFVSYCVSQGITKYFSDDWYITNNSVLNNDGSKYLKVYSLQTGHTPLEFSEYEQSIEQSLTQFLENCINMELYEEQGYDATRDAIHPAVTITPQNILVHLDTHMQITKNDLLLDRNEFDVQVDVPLGKLFYAYAQAVNAELETGSFDQVAFMSSSLNQNGDDPLILIEKHKPYPNILYDFEMTYKQFVIPLRIAIEGQDVFADSYIRQSYFTPSKISCMTDFVCYAGVSQEKCLQIDGTYQQSICEDDQTQSQINSQSQFASCGSYNSGESWCDVSIGVGSRHIKSYCFDGIIYDEPCRDFRQEVCVSNDDNAYCRTNSALSCLSCTTKDCCERSDCVFEQNQCIPKVPIGLPVWDSAKTTQYCSLLQTQAASANQCAKIADCGDSFTLYGDKTGQQSDSYYSDLESHWQLYRSLTPQTSQVSSAVYSVNAQSLSQRFYSIVSDLEAFSQTNVTTYLDPTQQFTTNSVSSQCSAFIPPAYGNCGYCDVSAGCDEYMCRSLGSTCRLVTREDGSVCESVTQSSTMSILQVDASHDLAPTSLDDLNGYSMNTQILPFENIQINITTSAPSLCKPTYLPYQEFKEVRSRDLSNGNYTTNHILEIQFVNDLPVFSQLKNQFAVVTYDELASALVSFKYTLDQLHSRYGFVQKFRPSFGPYLDDFVDAYINPSKTQTIRKLFTQLENKRYTLFFVCQDSLGLASADTFVTFGLEQSCEDGPIKILQTSLDKDTFIDQNFTVYTNRPAQCSVSINATSTCGTVTPFGYACTFTPVTVLDHEHDVSISCTDYDYSAKTVLVQLNETANNVTVSYDTITDQTSITAAINSTLAVEFEYPITCEAVENPVVCTSTVCKTTFKNLTQNSEITCTPKPSSCAVSSEITTKSITITPVPNIEIGDAIYQNSTLFVSVIPRSDVTRCFLTNSAQELIIQNQTTFVGYIPYTDTVRILCSDELGSVGPITRVVR